jgi:Protein of unknown function (DUF3237)
MTNLETLKLAQAQVAQIAPFDLQTRLVWNAVVDIGERQPLGPSPLGERWIVPILGGVFWGSEHFAALEGVVLPGGADRQLQRTDGARQLQALYEMRSSDGFVLTVLNQVIIDDAAPPHGYRMSQVQVTVAQGPHDWLNRRVLVGTLQPLRPAREAVLVRVYVLE